MVRVRGTVRVMVRVRESYFHTSYGYGYDNGQGISVRVRPAYTAGCDRGQQHTRARLEVAKVHEQLGAQPGSQTGPVVDMSVYMDAVVGVG